MNLEAKINEELKAAIKKGDKLRMETLRSIRAAIIEFNKSGVGREMNEDDEIKILQHNVKKRKDAIELYDKAERYELAHKERTELEIINEFLPKQLTHEEIKQVISDVTSNLGASDMKDFGRVMGEAMKQLKGRAEGSMVQEIVKNILSNS